MEFNLQVLDLGKKEALGDESIMCIKKFHIQFKSLQNLNLEQTKISTKGAFLLFEAGANMPEINELNIAKNKLENEAIYFFI